MLAFDPARDVGDAVRSMTRALAHRGPDGDGFEYVWRRAAALGHRRLSIIDVDGGAQPMENEDGRVSIVFNGEIYNFRELRHELVACGHAFRTRSDTEVLIHGWEEWGVRLLERLNGMYAFALFDGRTAPGSIWLARDPVGVKPLYLGRGPWCWWFASELQAAREGGVLEASIRNESLEEYLVYRFVPSPATLFRDTWKVPPGHWCRLPLPALPAEPTFEAFAPAFAPAVLPKRREEWMEAVRDGLRGAVRRQLVSDVPLGALLSGGVDSTVVTRLMTEALPDPPQAFAIGFREEGPDGELGAAQLAADALGVPLHRTEVGEREFLRAWPDHVAKMSEPIGNSGVQLIGHLCQSVGSHRKVVLTGQGADEPLGGYPRHAAERLAPWRHALRPLLALTPPMVARGDRVSRLRRVMREGDEARRFAEILAVFAPAEAVWLTGSDRDPDWLVSPVRRWLPAHDDGSAVNRLLRVDARLSLADDLLIVADHTAMASSVELRVPFLDLEFLALIDRMPARYKVSLLGERKWLYRDAVRPLLPEAIRRETTGWKARTGRKLGFTTPLDRWFRGWVERDATRDLLGPSACLPDYLEGDRLRELLTDVRERRLARERQLLALYVLETWLQRVLKGVAARAPQLAG